MASRIRIYVEADATQANAVINALKANLSGMDGIMVSSMRRAKEATDSWTRSMNAARDTANEMVRAGERMTLGLSLPLIGAIGYLGKYASMIERARISFETLTKSTAVASMHIKELQEFAATTPFNFTTLLEQSRLLQGVGFKVQEIIPMLRSVGGATVVAGGGNDALERIILQLTHMQALGRVTMRELNPIARSGVPVFEWLRDAIKEPKELDQEVGARLRSYMMKGLLSAQATIPFLLAKMNQEYSKGLERQGETIQTKFSNVIDRLQILASTLGESVFSDPIKKFLDQVNALLVRANDLAKAMDKLSPGMKTFIVAVTALLAVVGPLTYGFSLLFRGILSGVKIYGDAVKWIYTKIAAQMAEVASNARVVASNQAVAASQVAAAKATESAAAVTQTTNRSGLLARLMGMFRRTGTPEADAAAATAATVAGNSAQRRVARRAAERAAEEATKAAELARMQSSANSVSSWTQFVKANRDAAMAQTADKAAAFALLKDVWGKRAAGAATTAASAASTLNSVATAAVPTAATATEVVATTTAMRSLVGVALDVGGAFLKWNLAAMLVANELRHLPENLAYVGVQVKELWESLKHFERFVIRVAVELEEDKDSMIGGLLRGAKKSSLIISAGTAALSDTKIGRELSLVKTTGDVIRSLGSSLNFAAGRSPVMEKAAEQAALAQKAKADSTAALNLQKEMDRLHSSGAIAPNLADSRYNQASKDPAQVAAGQAQYLKDSIKWNQEHNRQLKETGEKETMLLQMRKDAHEYMIGAQAKEQEGLAKSLGMLDKWIEEHSTRVKKLDQGTIKTISVPTDPAAFRDRTLGALAEAEKYNEDFAKKLREQSKQAEEAKLQDQIKMIDEGLTYRKSAIDQMAAYEVISGASAANQSIDLERKFAAERLRLQQIEVDTRQNKLVEDENVRYERSKVTEEQLKNLRGELLQAALEVNRKNTENHNAYLTEIERQRLANKEKLEAETSRKITEAERQQVLARIQFQKQLEDQTREIRQNGVLAAIEYGKSAVNNRKDAELDALALIQATTLQAQQDLAKKRYDITVKALADEFAIEKEMIRQRTEFAVDKQKEVIAKSPLSTESAAAKDAIKAINEEAANQIARLNDQQNAAINAATRKQAIEQHDIIVNNAKGIFATTKQAANGIIDQLFTKTQSFGQALANAIKAGFLTAFKDILSSQIARFYTQLVTKQQVSFKSTGSGVGGFLSRMGTGEAIIGNPAQQLTGNVLPTMSPEEVAASAQSRLGVVKQIEQMKANTVILQATQVIMSSGALGASRIGYRSGGGAMGNSGAPSGYFPPDDQNLGTFNGGTPGQIGRGGIFSGADPGNPAIMHFGGSSSPFSYDYNRANGFSTPSSFGGGTFGYDYNRANPVPPYTYSGGPSSSSRTSSMVSSLKSFVGMGPDNIVYGTGPGGNPIAYPAQVAWQYGGLGMKANALFQSPAMGVLGGSLMAYGMAQPAGSLKGSLFNVGGGALLGASMLPKLLTSIGLKGLGAAGGAAVGAGGMLMFDGLKRGGLLGSFESVGGGAMAGAAIGSIVPGIGTLIGAGIGAAIGGVASLIRHFVPSGADKVKQKVKELYNVNIDNKGILNQLWETIKQNYGGNVDVGIRSPQIREMIELYAQTTGQRFPLSNKPMALFLQESGGKLFQDPTFRNGESIGYSGGLPLSQQVDRLVQYGQYTGYPGPGYLTQSPYGQAPTLMQLDANATTAFLQGQAIETMKGNPRAVQEASLNSMNQSSGRMEAAVATISPNLVTR